MYVWTSRGVWVLRILDAQPEQRPGWEEAVLFDLMGAGDCDASFVQGTVIVLLLHLPIRVCYKLVARLPDTDPL